MWKLDKKMARQGRKILLFMDNAPSHIDMGLRNIELKYQKFPPNTTSGLQPMDQGIIQTVFRWLLQYEGMIYENSRETARDLKHVTRTKACRDMYRLASFSS
ncbi:hypothetical protein Bbelb_231780 [Branchiostoma belcheri]|nr:hypothetical protein Bbelb_231780 [Branchiostoma belcheri]